MVSHLNLYLHLEFSLLRLHPNDETIGLLNYKMAWKIWLEIIALGWSTALFSFHFQITIRHNCWKRG